MKMKKLTALLLAGVMIMSAALTGCGSGDSGSGSEKDSGGKAGERKKITALLRCSETSTKYIILKKIKKSVII